MSQRYRHPDLSIQELHCPSDALRDFVKESSPLKNVNISTVWISNTMKTSCITIETHGHILDIMC